MNDTWNEDILFVSKVYTLYKPEFLEPVNKITDIYIENMKRFEGTFEDQGVLQTDRFDGEESLREFTSYIAQTSWNILSSQGFNMENKQTYFIELWAQHIYKYGFMLRHVHNINSQISGFYILENNKDTPKIMVHDPRPGKEQISLDYDKYSEKLFECSERVEYDPTPGTLLFFNSWLPHTITRNMNTDPYNLIHFNLGVRDFYRQSNIPPAEVI
jgi:Putative 2OG-Fe(II) oxygenase